MVALKGVNIGSSQSDLKPEQDMIDRVGNSMVVMVVRVWWVDSTTTMGWCLEDVDGPTVIESVGQLVREDEESVVLSTSRSREGRYIDQLTIPRRCIRKMRKLREN